MTNEQINRLVAQDPNNIQSPVLAAAVKELRARQEKEQTERAIIQLGAVARNTESAVNNLRQARKVENAAKTLLVAYADAESNFQKTGDFAAYEKAILAANRANQGNRY
jgi:hypothetical protein